MKHVTATIDFISPYAWLAFADLPRQLEGLSWHVRWRPVLLGALLKSHGNPGPLAVPAKAQWLRRHCGWLGQHLGMGLDWPAVHPFDPLPLLRLALQCSEDGHVNRFVAGAVLRHVWLGGHDALAPERLEALRSELQPQLRCDEATARQLLRSNTDAALAEGVFGVPSFHVDGQLLWGLDSLPMLRSIVAQSPPATA
ncbi:2-hydroxychromene-2-carboxylate isomerase [Comamonas faecalis]|uniref:2-hydroxychromene-2-carboxylate isomerase n=1 Tax=Comamonas faecalis TaxID=1387849 RepID=A0ABP7RCV9_9BURK